MPWWDSTVNQPKTKSRFIVVFGSMFMPNIKSATKPTVQFETKSYKLMNHHYNYPGTVKWDPVQIKMVCMNPFDVRDMDGDVRQKGLDTADMLWQMIRNTGYYYPDKEAHALSRNGKEAASITTPEKASTIANGFGTGLAGDTGYQPGGSSGNSFQRVKIIQISTGTNHNTVNNTGVTPSKTPINIVEEWDLVNPLIKTINFGDLSYDDDNLVEYTLDIVYDYAIYNKEVLERSSLPVDSIWQSYSKGTWQEVQELTQQIDAEIAAQRSLEATPTAQNRAAVDIGTSWMTDLDLSGGPPEILDPNNK